jgi:hypothetical protein
MRPLVGDDLIASCYRGSRASLRERPCTTTVQGGRGGWGVRQHGCVALRCVRSRRHGSRAHDYHLVRSLSDIVIEVVVRGAGETCAAGLGYFWGWEMQE